MVTALYVLRGFGTETPTDVFRRNIGELWGYSHDRFARYLSKLRSRERPGQLDARSRHGQSLMMTMAMHREGVRVRRDLEHEIWL